MAAKAWVVAAMLVGLPFSAARAEESPKDAGLREARGAVNQVDKEKNRVIVDSNKGSPLTLQVDKTTTIFIDGPHGTLDEIKAGAEVRASYETKQGANKAQWIEISKKEKKPAAAKEKPEGAAPGKQPAVPLTDN
jgi:Cu/Ag efflux protein CusF